MSPVRAHLRQMPSVTELRTAHTADLDASTLSAIRDLMNAVFNSVSDDTFDNALGGVHALVFEDGELIAHGSVVQRRLVHGGRALRTGYVEGVVAATAGNTFEFTFTTHFIDEVTRHTLYAFHPSPASRPRHPRVAHIALHRRIVVLPCVMR